MANPDGYDWEDEQLRRQIAEASALRQRAMQGGGGMVGPIYVGKNPWATLAESLAGGILENRAVGRQKELQQGRDQEYQDWVASMPGENATPAELQAHALRGMVMRAPTGRQVGAMNYKSALDTRAEAAKLAREREEGARVFKVLQSLNAGPPVLTGEEAGADNKESLGFTGDPAQRLQEIMALPDSPDKTAALAQLQQQTVEAKLANAIPASVAIASMGGKVAGKVAPLLAATENASRARDWRRQDKADYAKLVSTLKSPSTVAIQTVDDQGRPITKIVPKVEGATYPGQPSATERKLTKEQQDLAREVTTAIAKVQANPEAFGLKTFLPSWVLDRAYSEGTGTRAIVGALTSAKIKDMSGAAVSSHEQTRLNKFLPADGDPSETVITKLKQYQEELARKGYTIESEGGFNASEFEVVGGE